MVVLYNIVAMEAVDVDLSFQSPVVALNHALIQIQHVTRCNTIEELSVGSTMAYCMYPNETQRHTGDTPIGYDGHLFVDT